MPTLAERQLAAWEALARPWRISLGDDGVIRCGRCGKGIALWRDRAGKAYRYDDGQILALTVLHLRNHHPDLDPDPPAQPL